MHSHTKAIYALLISIFLTAGCGQKGPLFLPGNTNEVSTSIPQQTSNAPSNEAEDDDDNKKPVNIN